MPRWRRRPNENARENVEQEEEPLQEPPRNQIVIDPPRIAYHRFGGIFEPLNLYEDVPPPVEFGPVVYANLPEPAPQGMPVVEGNLGDALPAPNPEIA